jgi:type IV secretory pathway component VirB8
MEPPILMSRILTFMLATSVVVLVTLVVALVKMMPLERPEVFFLLNHTLSVNTVIEPLVPNPNNEEALSNYEEGFIREYVIARNTLLQNTALTRKNWTSVIKPWSSNRVFAALTQTSIYQEYTNGDMIPVLSCSVNFSDTSKEQAVVKTDHTDKYEEYVVTFAWICKNSGGQTPPKNYKIRLRIQSVLDNKVSNTLENLEKLRDNPLGTRVVEYTVLSGNGDPLDSDIGSL